MRSLPNRHMLMKYEVFLHIQDFTVHLKGANSLNKYYVTHLTHFSTDLRHAMKNLLCKNISKPTAR